MTYLEYEYELYRKQRRRQRTRLQQARRTAARWKIAALIFAALLILSALAPLAFSKEEPEQTPPTETTDPVVTAMTIPPITAAPAVEEDCPLYQLEAISFYPVPLDHDLQAHIIRTCHAYGIDPTLVMAVIQKESSFDAAAIGDSGDSAGLMQVQEKWHRDRMERLGISDLLDPYQNTLVGIDYLAELLDKYPVSDALTTYNSGKPGESAYAEAVLKNLSILEESEP